MLRNIQVERADSLLGKAAWTKLQELLGINFFLGASVLACDNTRVIQASEQLFKLKAPIWYLRSLVETILIYQHFKKPGTEQPAPKQELVDFWMDFLVEATKKDVSSVRFPVLILEPTKVYQPSYLSINKDIDDNTVSIWHVAPDDKHKVHGVELAFINLRCPGQCLHSLMVLVLQLMWRRPHACF
ncbi:mitogen-activated protein kinase kinase kinase 5 [Lates japonicus]|uniref:Mitogen-activated protein kinase kinase kinase 5 n=1 Tax=Lates japonicus TaxID=270547 RepID=A0AAD3NHV4_LATJO|nr:mitogen-activated protein kinase kinase kinase 5 [Lates japonicus]